MSNHHEVRAAPRGRAWRGALRACAVALGLGLALAACGDDAGDDGATNAGPTRGYRLSAAAVQAVVGAPQLFQQTPGAFSFGALAADVDTVSVVLENYGVPWDEFAAAATPPAAHPWTVAMRGFAAAARATGKPLVVQTVLSRERLAGRALDQAGQLVVDPNWQPACFDFSTSADGARYRLAYARYVAWLTTLFEPSYFVHAVELSNARHACPSDAAWQALVAVANDAYDAVKAARPATLAMPSFILSELYADRIDGFDAALVAQLAALKRDRLGLSVYPQGLKTAAGAGITPADLPTDLLSRPRDRNPAEAPIVVTETGWNSSDLAVGTSAAACPVLQPSTQAAARDYLDFVLGRAAAQRIELVTWWSDRDLTPAAVMTTCYPDATAPAFAACNGDAWCVALNLFRQSTPANPALGEVLFKAFGTMGLRDHAGGEKPLMLARWRAALALPYKAP